jgi:competence protein ComEC
MSFGTAEDAGRQPPVWSAPLLGVALALSAGILADRLTAIPLFASLGATFLSLLAWVIFACSTRRGHGPLALTYLWGAVAGLGAAHHHWHCHYLAADDIVHFADADGVPARLRGVLETAPSVQTAKRDPLRTFPAGDSSRFVLAVQRVKTPTGQEWHDATGRVQVIVIGQCRDITVGDEVEVLGRLSVPNQAMNPGELDYASYLRDQRITAVLSVQAPSDVMELRRGWPMSLFGWLSVVRGWGQRTLKRDLGRQHAVAAALLLGEGSEMTGDDWEQYMRTGVIHVLAISGQHLVILAGFLWLASRLVGVRRRRAAPILALLLIGYALLAGGRPPVMRAAWVVAIYCGGILLQRPPMHANTFAFAWIGVAVVNPTDIFNAGCQLSFLAVVVLVWGIGRWTAPAGDPINRFLREFQPWYALLTGWACRWVLTAYAVNAVVWLALAPLVAAHFHLVSPITLVLGPPMILLTSLALLSGFAFLLFSWLPPLAWPFGLTTQGCLHGCEMLVTYGERVPGGYFYVADVPAWWLGVFYAALLLALAVPLSWRVGRWLLAAGCIWLALGVTLQLLPHRPGELRCTFVAVGHGGCTVIETPTGRVLVYDAGAATGPDVTRRHIAPFLWSRGIRRIDDLILSHADLDHFNGVPQLAERFAIGRVLTTPTFAQRDLPGVQKTLGDLESRGLPITEVQAGYRFDEGDVLFEVLHPPAAGPPGKENVRSLVLLVRHGDWSMLLTGDLEDAGLRQLLELKPTKVDVLMAPHHGSDRSNVLELARWARPRFVVSSQAAPSSPRESVKMYEQLGAKYLSTWPHGAVTIRPGAEAQVETYRTRLRLP